VQRRLSLVTVITSLLTSITLLSDNYGRERLSLDQVIVLPEHRNTAVFRPQIWFNETTIC